MEDDEILPMCRVCRESYTDQRAHNDTVNHRFLFVVWAYNMYRKALVKDRHGIVLEIIEQVVNNFNFIFNYSKNKGKYVTQVTPEQLRLHNKTITFNCKITNTRKEPIYVININLLHTSPYFTMVHTNDFGQETGIFLKLQPGALYNFQIIFSTKVLASASYKIPLSCDFQTVDNKNAFTIVRTFLVIIDDQKEENETKTKSPFTSQSWKEVKKLIATVKETSYPELYHIPSKYVRLLKHGLQRFDNMNKSDSDNFRKLSHLVKSGVTIENYSDFWHIMLWMEEMAQSLMLTKYNMEKVTMTIANEEVLVLEVPGLAEKRPSVIVGDFIKVRVSGDHTAYKGFVGKVHEKTIEISHIDDELMEYVRRDPTTEFDVSFVLSRLGFERMHQAVDRIVATNMVKILFPKCTLANKLKTTYSLQDWDFYNKEVVDNLEQKNAVLKILNSTQNLPYIVFGPPGTGKTVTIVEAILQIKKRTKKKILVCAPANSACDVIAKKLIPYCSKKELIRIHSSTRETLTITEDLKEYSNMEDEEFTKINTEQLVSFRIIVTTLTLIGRYTRDYQPDVVFVDEAAQASEPETDIAIALLSVGKQVILAGDPKQLGPMVTECAAKLGLGVSLLERLMKCEVYKPNGNTGGYNSDFITMLKLNFRSHPDILFISNQLFYDNNLKPRSVSAASDPITRIPIYPEIQPKKTRNPGKASKVLEFCSVNSKERREGSSPSYFNQFEAKAVVAYVKALMNLNLRPEHEVKEDQVGVITPYKRQVYKIHRSLQHNGFEGVEVGTAESFQGREKRIIIISTVRAQHSLLRHDRKYNLGFVKHDQRFNVALTRAISKLIVVGCPLVLMTDEKWEMYVKLCKDKGTFFGNHLELRDEAFKSDVLQRTTHFKEKDDQYQQN